MSQFVVVQRKKIQPIAFTPADFLGQKVLINGRAEAEANTQNIIDVPIAAVGTTCRALGRIGETSGHMVTLEGVAVRGERFPGDPKGPIFQVQKIQERASQACIEIPVRPYRSDFGEPYYSSNLDNPDSEKPAAELSLPRLEFGQTYKFRGFETGGFVGDAIDAAHDREATKQHTGLCFASAFVVLKGKKIAPIVFTPADFLGQMVLIHGRTVKHDAKVWLTGRGWELEVPRNSGWLTSTTDASFTVAGMIFKGSDANFLSIDVHRVQFDDLDREGNGHIQLHGRARSRDGHWLFNCNGQNILVENMDRLVAATSIGPDTLIDVSGVFCKEPIRGETAAGKSQQYTMREASCRVAADVLPIERVAEPCLWSIGTR